jgi:hypothetical protein
VEIPCEAGKKRLKWKARSLLVEIFIKLEHVRRLIKISTRRDTPK